MHSCGNYEELQTETTYCSHTHPQNHIFQFHSIFMDKCVCGQSHLANEQMEQFFTFDELQTNYFCRAQNTSLNSRKAS